MSSSVTDNTAMTGLSVVFFRRGMQWILIVLSTAPAVVATSWMDVLSQRRKHTKTVSLDVEF